MIHSINPPLFDIMIGNQAKTIQRNFIQSKYIGAPIFKTVHLNKTYDRITLRLRVSFYSKEHAARYNKRMTLHGVIQDVEPGYVSKHEKR